MKETLIVVGLAAVAVVVGGTLFVFGPSVPSSGAKAPVPFTEITSGTQSAVAKRVNYLISSEEQFDHLWKLIHTEKSRPSIDFSKSVVAAVFAGTLPTAGYEIQVAQVADVGSARMVNVVLKKPGENCALAEVQTAPYQIVEIPRSELPLTHEDLISTVNCL